MEETSITGELVLLVASPTFGRDADERVRDCMTGMKVDRAVEVLRLVIELKYWTEDAASVTEATGVSCDINELVKVASDDCNSAVRVLNESEDKSSCEELVVTGPTTTAFVLEPINAGYWVFEYMVEWNVSPELRLE